MSETPGTYAMSYTCSNAAGHPDGTMPELYAATFTHGAPVETREVPCPGCGQLYAVTVPASSTPA